MLIDREQAETEEAKSKVDTGEYELIYKGEKIESDLNTIGLNLDIIGKRIPETSLSKW